MARAVEDFGKGPNWSRSIIFNTAGAMKADTTKSSANLEIIGVREMGRKFFFYDFDRFLFMNGYHIRQLPRWGKLLLSKAPIKDGSHRLSYKVSIFPKHPTRYPIGTRSLGGVQLSDCGQNIDLRNGYHRRVRFELSHYSNLTHSKF